MQVGFHDKPWRKHAVVAKLMREVGIAAVVAAHGLEGHLASLRAEYPHVYVDGIWCSNRGREERRLLCRLDSSLSAQRRWSSRSWILGVWFSFVFDFATHSFEFLSFI